MEQIKFKNGTVLNIQGGMVETYLHVLNEGLRVAEEFVPHLKVYDLTNPIERDVAISAVTCTMASLVVLLENLYGPDIVDHVKKIYDVMKHKSIERLDKLDEED